jgi:hypothetical protein
LYNDENIDVTRTASIAGNTSIVARRVFVGTFGKNDKAGLTSIEDVHLKEFRLWW